MTELSYARKEAVIKELLLPLRVLRTHWALEKEKPETIAQQLLFVKSVSIEWFEALKVTDLVTTAELATTLLPTLEIKSDTPRIMRRRPSPSDSLAINYVLSEWTNAQERYSKLHESHTIVAPLSMGVILAVGVIWALQNEFKKNVDWFPVYVSPNTHDYKSAVLPLTSEDVTKKLVIVDNATDPSADDHKTKTKTSYAIYWKWKEMGGKV
jgi:hypothetical protein